MTNSNPQDLIELLELGGDYAADAYNDFRDKSSPCAQRALANITRFNEARAKAQSQQAEIERRDSLIRTLLDNDPNEPIADNGMTVLDGWRQEARTILGER